MKITFQLKHALQYFYYNHLCKGKNHRMVTLCIFLFRQTTLRVLIIKYVYKP